MEDKIVKVLVKSTGCVTAVSESYYEKYKTDGLELIVETPKRKPVTKRKPRATKE